MNEYQFNYLLEQLQKQEEESEKLDQRVDDLTHTMKTLARSIKILTKKLDKPPAHKRSPERSGKSRC